MEAGRHTEAARRFRRANPHRTRRIANCQPSIDTIPIDTEFQLHNLKQFKLRYPTRSETTAIP